MPVLNPDHLLEQADQLIAPAGAGAPRQADLRRAISAAYYSVFHAVATEAADSFAGKTQRQSPRYALVYRSIEHRSLRGICEDVIKATLPARYVRHEPSGGFGPDIIELATAVIDLQEKRHAADYDPLFRASTAEAIVAVQTGRNALSRLRHANPTRRRAFLSLVVFSPR
jgi:ATP phosphoribosyltransferase regulatory subunit HisZ